MLQLKISKQFSEIFFTVTLFLLFSQTTAYAEPGGSNKYMPILWSIVLIGATLTSMIPWIFRKFSKEKRSKLVYLVASVVFALMFLIFMGPIIIALGNILLSGRTM